MTIVRYPRSINSLEDSGGCLVIEHVPTGRICVEVSKKMRSDAIDSFNDITRGVYHNKRLQTNFSMDPDIKYIGYPFKLIRESRAKAMEIMATYPQHLLLNNPAPKHNRRRRRNND